MKKTRSPGGSTRRPGGSTQRFGGSSQRSGGNLPRAGERTQRRQRRGTKAMFANYLAVAPSAPGGDASITSAEELDRWFREQSVSSWGRRSRE